ncbi:MAG: alanine--tRNA ligase [Spirochaetia bacterium]|jgi:alanyl-tRNA synthetase|nr:alanine--tRNA ligase [Spirochaetia bacterium]
MLKIMDLRTSFVNFFGGKGHKIVPSSPLVPKDDPTLLFTTAGMVQFKPMFAGTVDLEYTRAASVQKCLRTSDLENVGKTKRHLTFFEMLGNFSFGDYFKKEAVRFAWDFSTSVIGFPAEKIWVSIYQDDDEAFEIWNKDIGVPAEKIVRLGKADNFWGPAGDSGACGPCSELYLDRGEAFGCGSPDCKPGCDCERFLEYWNLVFNQFNQDTAGVLHPLPRTGIDTGMGLERLATLVQGVDSVYETDEFESLTGFISKESGLPYEGKNIVPMRVMAEHARSLTFAMSDGIYPSNDGRGYVLRRILRRGLRFSRLIGIKEPFLYKICDPIVNTMGGFYPELKEPLENVKSVIESEERRFLETIENGMDRLEEIMKGLKKSGKGVIAGRDVFVLYDTFGFPVEMTNEIAADDGISVDLAGFEEEMEIQRSRGKQSWKAGDQGLGKYFEQAARKSGDTAFKGYEHETFSSQIQSLFNESGGASQLSEGNAGFIILKETPFYGESGGQAGDIGLITSKSAALFEVEDTKKFNKTFMHIGHVVKGTFKEGDDVDAAINTVHRNLIRANHTATHLLQAALRKTLGHHVKQAGSIVDADHLRFDFSHFNPMSDDEIQRVEDTINEKIWENIELTVKEMDIKEAVASGAMAVFDEKYEERVRVVTVEGFSSELCGGTHVGNTGKIGTFKILKEMSPGAGLRRIEGATLKGLLDRYNAREKAIGLITSKLNVNEKDVYRRVEDLVDKNKALEKELEKLRKESLSSGAGGIMEGAVEIKGVKIVSRIFDSAGVNELRELSDSIRERERCSVVLFGSQSDGKAVLLYAATKEAVDKGIDCGSLIKKTAGFVAGSGGGRKDMAQAGGKSPEGLKQAVGEAFSLIENFL